MVISWQRRMAILALLVPLGIAGSGSMQTSFGQQPPRQPGFPPQGPAPGQAGFPGQPPQGGPGAFGQPTIPRVEFVREWTCRLCSNQWETPVAEIRSTCPKCNGKGPGNSSAANPPFPAPTGTPNGGPPTAGPRPAPAPAPTSRGSSPGSEGLSGGVIAGIISGVLLLAAVGVGAVVIIVRGSGKSRDRNRAARLRRRRRPAPDMV
jgi:hypothetical protein